jgi:hypothetical protein
MKSAGLWMLTAVVGVALQAQAVDRSRGELIVEASDAVTLGKLTYDKVTVNIKQSYVNPRVMAEYRFGGTALSLGGEFSKLKNDYDGTFEYSDGSMTMDRTDWTLFARLGYRDSVNLRVGYRNFAYDVKDAILNQRDNGVLTEQDTNGTAKGDLTTGIDAELNLVFGEKVQVGLSLGGTYFIGAKYDWAYDAAPGGHKTGTAKVDAYSARIRPELAFLLADNLQLFVNYTLMATMWKGREVGNTNTDYPAYDVISAVGVGLRYSFGGP